MSKYCLIFDRRPAGILTTNRSSFIVPLQREEEAAGQHRESHPVQHVREEVHGHRGAQDQPDAAGLHQEPLRLHPGRSRQLKRAKGKGAAAAPTSRR